MSDSPAAHPDPFLRLKAGDVPCPAPVFASPAESVALAAARMAQAGATAALVRADSPPPGALLGILTERDVLTRLAAAGLDSAATPVERVMTPAGAAGLASARPEETLLAAFSRMVRRRVRRLVLLDATGAPVGMLGEGELLAARGESPLALAGDIDAAGDAAGLARARERLARLAARSVAEGLDAATLGGLMSEMHDRMAVRAWALALEELGPAPAPHALLAFGSQARGEQYLATDLDLGLAHWGGEAEAAWFAELGRRIAALLLAAGFPPCPRGILPDNPAWVRTARGWLDLARDLAEAPDDAAVVTASILADLRPLPGPTGTTPEGGEALGAEVPLQLTRGGLLLKRMAREATRFRPPLGLFRGFSLTRDDDGREGLDVKRGGVFPITQGAKALALSHGLSAPGTVKRLRALAGAEALSPRQAEGLCEAFSLLQTLRMRAQARALAEGRTPDNMLRPEELGPLEAEGLRSAFKLVAELQDRLATAFALHLLT